MEKTELLACPFCDGEAALEDWKVGYESGTTVLCVYCGACISESVVDGDGWHERAVEKWNRRTPSPGNKPLTVEELRERKKPVWCDIPDCEWIPAGGYYCLCDGGFIIAPSGQRFSADECLKNGWVLLDRPPEKGGSRRWKRRPV